MVGTSFFKVFRCFYQVNLLFDVMFFSGEEDGYSDSKHAEAAAAEEEHRS